MSLENTVLKDNPIFKIHITGTVIAVPIKAQ